MRWDILILISTILIGTVVAGIVIFVDRWRPAPPGPHRPLFHRICCNKETGDCRRISKLHKCKKDEVDTIAKSCTPNPCIKPQSCCGKDGKCRMISYPKERCTKDETMKDSARCDPNPCPQPQICCGDQGKCREIMYPDVKCTDAEVMINQPKCDDKACIFCYQDASNTCAQYKDAKVKTLCEGSMPGCQQTYIGGWRCEDGACQPAGDDAFEYVDWWECRDRCGRDMKDYPICGSFKGSKYHCDKRTDEDEACWGYYKSMSDCQSKWGRVCGIKGCSCSLQTSGIVGPPIFDNQAECKAAKLY